MNFLGHLFFTPDNPELRIANLFGDFVKGSDLSMYNPIIQRGILLHREIDSYIDHHPAVLELMHSLYPSLPKVSGIAVDLYFDHLLAKNWSDYSDTSLEDFVAAFYESIDELPEVYPLEFRYVLSKMKHDNWLLAYREFKGLEMACKGLSQRIRFKNVLDQAPQAYLQHNQLVEQTFRIYMSDALAHFT